MKLRLLSAALILAATSSAFAQQANAPELSAPIVAFTPVIAKNADALALSEAQRADLKAWMDTMPAQRKAIEDAALATRAQLREAIISGAPTDQRQALAAEIGALETQLVMARSNCVDHWRDVLSSEQFDQMLQLAQAQ